MATRRIGRPSVSSRGDNLRYVGSFEPSVDSSRRLSALLARDGFRLFLGDIFALRGGRGRVDSTNPVRAASGLDMRFALIYRLVRADLTAVS